MCFDNLIGIRGECSDTDAPTSGFFINDLAGITLKSAANIANDEYVKGIELLRQVIATATTLVRRELINQMLGLVRFNAITDTVQVGDFQDDFLSVAASEDGITSKLDCGCRWLTQYIPTIDILLNTTVSDKVLKIIDGPVTTEFEFDAIAGNITTIHPKYRATNETIQIVIDRSDVSVNNSFLNTCNSCGDCQNNHCECDCCSVQITSTGTGSFGLKPIINIECSEDKFTCELAHFLAIPIWYKAGVQFLEELIFTDRLNVYTIYGVEEAKEQIIVWETKAEEDLKAMIKRLPDYFGEADRCCLTCDSSHWVEAHP